REQAEGATACARKSAPFWKSPCPDNLRARGPPHALRTADAGTGCSPTGADLASRRMTRALRPVRVDEELHVVDLRTLLPVRRAVEIVDAAAHPDVRVGRHDALVVTDCGSHTGLDQLGAAVRAGRSRVQDAAEGLGAGMVAAGALPSPGISFRPDGAEVAPGYESRTRADARFR